jgi:phosphatidate cytidylyltransferase
MTSDHPVSTTPLRSELSKRIQTGVAGALVVILLIVFGGGLGVAFIAAVMAVAMIYEFVEMTFTLPDRLEKRGFLMGIAWLLAFFNYWVPRAEYELLLVTFIALFSYFLFTSKRHEGETLKNHFQELMYSIFGLLYLAFLPLFLVLIRNSTGGVHWTILFLFIVWAGDTGAYFAGKKYGRHKLYPHISPKKTREGAIGGLLAGILITLIYKLIFFPSLSWFSGVAIPLIIGVAAPVGDLAESFLKRAFNKKDSGTLLPGHGGFLDRFDGVIWSAPIMYACIRVFG